jgi:hypothetical protein
MRIARSGSHSKALEHGRYARTNHIQRLVKAGNPDGGTLGVGNYHKVGIAFP